VVDAAVVVGFGRGAVDGDDPFRPLVAQLATSNVTTASNNARLVIP
jgi:hypothetical protein